MQSSSYCILSHVFQPSGALWGQTISIWDVYLKGSAHAADPLKCIVINYTGVDPKQDSGNFEGGDHHLGRGGITVNNDALESLRAAITTWAEAGSL